MLQGIVVDNSLKLDGEEVGGVEKRRQALARLHREHAGKRPGPVHRHDGQRCWQAGAKGTSPCARAERGEKLGLGRKRTTRRTKCPLPYCNTIQFRTVRGRRRSSLSLRPWPRRRAILAGFPFTPVRLDQTLFAWWSSSSCSPLTASSGCLRTSFDHSAARVS